MPITPGTKLGPYEIVAPLGAGGMGEVYRARDTRLGRDVAVKVVPEHLSATPEVRARFEREARTISSLNHPHICTLHDVGREGDTDYLVMELVDGETLAQRLAKGALPVADVLRIGAQVADALDRAHRAGVVHRDLKPANIMLTRSGAKLMDFGLASTGPGLAGPGSGSRSLTALTHSPTVAAPLTAEGTIVGTFQYMSPEQLEGRDADARADLWALGCVLYEMATGQRAFEGRSQASLISSIMKEEPRPIAEVAPLTPPALDKLVRACLAKDPEERLQTAHDVKLQLSWLGEAGSQLGVPAPVAAQRRSREQWAWFAAAIGVLAAAAFGWHALGVGSRADELVQATVIPPEGRIFNPYACNITISPDGSTLAFISEDSSGTHSLWVRPLESTQARMLAPTDGQWPLWSPDGKFIGVATNDGKLVKLPVAGGPAMEITKASNGRGGTWNRDGVIVFAPAITGALMRVSADGGNASPATVLDTLRHETAHRFPYFLPDGDHFLYVALPGGSDGYDICLGSLHSHETRRLASAQSAAIYAEPGYLLFARDGRLMAQSFDLRKRSLLGTAQPITDAPPVSGLETEPVVSASLNGRLALLRSLPPPTNVVVIDSRGAMLSRITLPPAEWLVRGVSPDGRRAVLLNGEDIWVMDLERMVPLKTTFRSRGQQAVVWSPDGTRFAYVAKSDGRDEIFIVGADGRTEKIPTTPASYKNLNSWSPDGRYIVFSTLEVNTSRDLWMVEADGAHTVTSYLSEPGPQDHGRVSPDGRWLTYESDETGRFEVYVQSFPTPGHKARVTPEGGWIPLWGVDGRSLYFIRGSVLMRVPMELGAEARPGTPSLVFQLPTGTSGMDAIRGKGQFLLSMASAVPTRDIQLILGWPKLLKQ